MVRSFPEGVPVARLKVTKVGLKAFRQVGSFVKPTTHLIQIFGHAATKSRFRITKDALLKLHSGRDLHVPDDMEKGYVILELEQGQILGLGFVNKGSLRSQIPRKEIKKLMLETESPGTVPSDTHPGRITD